MSGRAEPRWLTTEQVIAIHDEQVAEFGGLPGIRDEGALHSAVDRPRNKWAYEEDSTLHDLAAAYGFGLARNHAFADGNKRTALVAMYAFLAKNGLRLSAEEADTVLTMVSLAEGKLSEVKLAAWLKANTKKRGSSE